MQNTETIQSSSGAASPVPGEVLALTDETFDALITNRTGIALVEFGASWCAPCRMMQPVLARLATKFAGLVTIATVDVDANPRTTAAFEARSLPTFLFFMNGTAVSGIVGAVAESRLVERLDAMRAAVRQAESP